MSNKLIDILDLQNTKNILKDKDMNHSIEKQIWELSKNIIAAHDCGDICNIDDISIHQWKDEIDDEQIKIYCSSGYCWELKKEYVCRVENYCNHEGVDNDGFCYTFCEPWEGYKESGINKAIEILTPYTKR